MSQQTDKLFNFVDFCREIKASKAFCDFVVTNRNTADPAALDAFLTLFVTPPPGITVIDGYDFFRGRCKEICGSLILVFPSLRLVRGHYDCYAWRTKEQHWWCVTPDGVIVDPTSSQFGCKGLGDYEEFDGTIACAQCGKTFHEDEAMLRKAGGPFIDGRYGFCSGKCYGKFVGVA
jgi:hypothetical protein